MSLTCITMAAVSIDVGGMEKLDCKSDPANMGQRWKWLKRSFEFFLTARGVVQNKQKRALLLHCAGPDVQEIFSTHLFRQLHQTECETMDQFITRLR